MFSVSALFAAAVIYADPAGAPNGALPPMKTNDKLLISPVALPEWQDTKGVLHRVQPIVKLEYFGSRAVDSSA